MSRTVTDCHEQNSQYACLTGTAERWLRKIHTSSTRSNPDARAMLREIAEHIRDCRYPGEAASVLVEHLETRES